MTTMPVRTEATPAVVSRRAALGTAGAALWVLVPAAWATTALEREEYGSLSFTAVATTYWFVMVLGPALLLAGYSALHAALGRARSRPATAGIALAAVGLSAMAVGNGIELASLSAGGEEVALGHALFLVGFLVSVGGGMLVGGTLVRRRWDALSRAAGWVLLLALPLGIGIGLLGSTIAPENDAAFWAVVTVPTGIAWLLLGRSLATGRRSAA